MFRRTPSLAIAVACGTRTAPVLRVDNTAEEFKQALNSLAQFEAAMMDEEFFKYKDNNNDTFLHWIARKKNLDAVFSQKIMSALSKVDDFAFNQLNDSGETPLHVAARNCEDKTICSLLFPEYLRRAVKINLSFDSLDARGHSVLHIVAGVTCAEDDGFSDVGYKNNVAQMLSIVPIAKFNLNVLSNSGHTALYYALSKERFEHVITLLKHGADPRMERAEDCSLIRIAVEKSNKDPDNDLLKQIMLLMKPFVATEKSYRELQRMMQAYALLFTPTRANEDLTVASHVRCEL